LIETLSTETVSAFQWPLSWGLSLGGEAIPLEPTKVRHQISGKVGWSYDFLSQKFRWTNLFSGAFQQDQEGQVQLTPGFDSRLWMIWHPRVRSFFHYEVFRFPLWSQESLRAGQAFDLNDQLELRLGWRGFQEADKTLVEKSFSLHQNFLF